jgi:hypothetical protein
MSVVMDINYPTLETPASPEYVLAVIRDMHRQAAQFDGEVDADAILTFGTTVADWRKACDLVGWRELGRALNTTWCIEASSAEWEAVFKPGCAKCLSDVCEFLAQRISRPQIRAALLLGSPCMTAGAFLTIRSLLHQAGADVRDIAPSTLLAPYTRRYSQLLLDAISKLAPGALPPVRISTPVYDAAIWGAAIGMVALIGGCCAGSPLLGVTGGSIVVVAYALAWTAALRLLPASVEFGSLGTFRDLSVAISSRQSASRESLDSRSSPVSSL